MWGLLYCTYGLWFNLGFGNQIVPKLCLYDCAFFFNWMVWIVVRIGKGWPNWVCEQSQNPASLAQASPSHLSESCRVSFFVLVHVSRLGNQGQGWATWSLAQERETPPSEVARKPGHFERDFSPMWEVLGFWATSMLA